MLILLDNISDMRYNKLNNIGNAIYKKERNFATLKKVNVKLQKLLAERNMSQSELARKANVRPNTISDLLKSDRSAIHFETLEKVAEALNLDSVNEIIEFEEEIL